MNRILFVPLTLVFVQMAGMVNGLNNTVCAEALNDSSTCISGLSNSNTLVCSGVCQSELIGVTAACENSVSLLMHIRTCIAICNYTYQRIATYVDSDS